MDTHDLLSYKPTLLQIFACIGLGSLLLVRDPFRYTLVYTVFLMIMATVIHAVLYGDSTTILEILKSWKWLADIVLAFATTMLTQ